MCSPGIGLLPVALGCLMAIGLVTTYIVAVMNGHVSAFLPYISDTGTAVPESCIFSQFFNIAAVLGFLTMYCRYKLIREITQDYDHTVTKVSKIGLWLALFSSFGLSLVANFQETKIEAVHLTGALMVFGLGVLYQLLDTAISYRMHPMYNGIYICRVRLAVALVGMASLFTAFIAGVVAREQWSAGFEEIGDDRQHWKPDDPGYTSHLVSTFGEWSMALSFLLYFFTYIRDFQKFHVEVEANLYVSHLDQAVTVQGDGPTERTRLLV